MEQCTAGSPVCAVAGARSARWGWLAMLDDGRLIASVESSATDDAHAVATAVTAADGAPAPLADDTKTAAIVECQRWLDASALRRDCGASEGIDALDAAIERRVAQVLGRAPRHERPVLLGLASRIRSSLGHARSLGAELALRASLHRQRPRTSAADLAWLAETAELAASTAHRGRYNGERPGIVALIALVPDVQSD